MAGSGYYSSGTGGTHQAVVEAVANAFDGPTQSFKGIIVDDNGDFVIYDKVGNRVSLPVSDQSTEQTLKEMLIELKKINIHLQSMTGERIES